MYYITDAEGNRVSFQEGGILQNHEVIDGAKVLVVEDSGKTFGLTAAAGAAITLPALAEWKFKFRTELLFATTNWTIVSATNVIEGHALVAGAPVVASNENTISFVATADSIGDYVEVECNGTSIFVNGSSVTAGSITFTAP